MTATTDAAIHMITDIRLMAPVIGLKAKDLSCIDGVENNKR
jgi:hypothetical protein